VIKALEWCAANIPDKDSEIDVHSDSEIVVKQLNGAYKVKSGYLSPLNAKARELASAFHMVRFLNVPRENALVSKVDSNLNTLLDAIGEKDK
jgi:ribonuclease HI